MEETHMYTPYGMVLRALRDANGLPLSVKEIAQKIFEINAYSISRNTIVEAIDHCKSVHHIKEDSERCGKLRIPVKIFSISKPINTIQNEHTGTNANDNGIYVEPAKGI